MTFMGFPGGSDSKESACNAGNLVSIPALDSLEEGTATHSHSHGEAWRAAVHGVGLQKLDTTEQLNNNSNALNEDKDQIYMFLLVNHNITNSESLYLTLCQVLF